MKASGEAVQTLVIGCGNVLRGDDAAGPLLVRRLWARGLPPGVRCVDGGTGGMDVALQMRGVPEVILVDACRSDSEPGSLFEVPGADVEHLPPLSGVNLHAFRWDHAIAFGRWLLKDEYPERVTACLVEGDSFEPGAPLSSAVDRALQALADRLLGEFWMRRGFALQDAANGDRGTLLEAVAAYRTALACGITAESEPEAHARIQSSLGRAEADAVGRRDIDAAIDTPPAPPGPDGLRFPSAGAACEDLVAAADSGDTRGVVRPREP